MSSSSSHSSLDGTIDSSSSSSSSKSLARSSSSSSSSSSGFVSSFIERSNLRLVLGGSSPCIISPSQAIILVSFYRQVSPSEISYLDRAISLLVGKSKKMLHSFLTRAANDQKLQDILAHPNVPPTPSSQSSSSSSDIFERAWWMIVSSSRNIFQDTKSLHSINLNQWNIAMENHGLIIFTDHSTAVFKHISSHEKKKKMSGDDFMGKCHSLSCYSKYVEMEKEMIEQVVEKNDNNILCDEICDILFVKIVDAILNEKSCDSKALLRFENQMSLESLIDLLRTSRGKDVEQQEMALKRIFEGTRDENLFEEEDEELEMSCVDLIEVCLIQAKGQRTSLVRLALECLPFVVTYAIHRNERIDVIPCFEEFIVAMRNTRAKKIEEWTTSCGLQICDALLDAWMMGSHMNDSESEMEMPSELHELLCFFIETVKTCRHARPKKGVVVFGGHLCKKYIEFVGADRVFRKGMEEEIEAEASPSPSEGACSPRTANKNGDFIDDLIGILNVSLKDKESSVRTAACELLEKMKKEYGDFDFEVNVAGLIDEDGQSRYMKWKAQKERKNNRGKRRSATGMFLGVKGKRGRSATCVRRTKSNPAQADIAATTPKTRHMSISKDEDEDIPFLDLTNRSIEKQKQQQPIPL